MYVYIYICIYTHNITRLAKYHLGTSHFCFPRCFFCRKPTASQGSNAVNCQRRFWMNGLDRHRPGPVGPVEAWGVRSSHLGNQILCVYVDTIHIYIYVYTHVIIVVIVITIIITIMIMILIVIIIVKTISIMVMINNNYQND